MDGGFCVLLLFLFVLFVWLVLITNILFMSTYGKTENHDISKIESSPLPCSVCPLHSCRTEVRLSIFSGYYTSIPGSCNFETQEQEWTTVCGLTQDSGDDFDWNVSSAGVTGKMSPGTDHTPGIHLGYSRTLLKLCNILL